VTLLVAAVSDSNIWMISDTAITGGVISTRQRAYQIKIVSSLDGHALIGFAGDRHHGARLMEAAAIAPAGPNAVDILISGHREYPSVEFAYGYIDDRGPHLVRVSEGTTQEVPALYIGLPDAFEHFQRIRHDVDIDHAPEAVKAFVCGARGSEPVPEAVSTGITSMLRLFAERSERDVGGWAIPFFLTPEGAFLVPASHSRPANTGSIRWSRHASMNSSKRFHPGVPPVFAGECRRDQGRLHPPP
jgi:hypothetical protein